MIAFIIRRLVQAVVVIIIVSILIFFMMRYLPGDPLLLYLADNQLDTLSEADIQNLRVRFGLDKSIPQQYFTWVGGAFRGDFGTSLVYRDKVGQLIAKCFPVTIHLGVLAGILSSIMGILAGVICALRRGKNVDAVVTSFANLGVCVPNFWMGILMVYLFGYHLKWLPICGYTSPFQDFWQSTRQLIMPVICLSFVHLSSTTRQTRSSMLEVVRQDYIRTAWAKGLRERAIVARHILKNGLIPIVTLIGLHARMILGGSVFIETVFNIPGMGRLMVDAVFSQDYPIVQSGCLIISSMVVFINLIVDISYGWLDPRIRYS